jgi:hypothetical protein
MPALLGTVRANLRTDLKDPSPGTRWSDAVLDRHIARAVSEYGRVRPREQRTTIATTNGSRFLDISSLTDLVEIEAVEYPIDLYPRVFTAFTQFAGTCEMLVDALPTGGNARVYWHGAHTLSTSVSTIYVEDEEIITAGAAAFALLEYAQYEVDRLNLGGDLADSEYHRQGRTFLERFRQMLVDLAGQEGVRSSRLFTAVEADFGRDVVTGS